MAVLADQVHRLTIDEYLHLVERDRQGRWARTELIEGVVYDVSPESSRHADAVIAVFDALRAALPGRLILNAGSVEVGDGSLWEPDVYVMAAETEPDRTYRLASQIDLAVEIAVSSLDRDATVKYRGYASAGVPQYWIVVHQPGGYVLRHRHPTGDRYRTVDRFEIPGGVSDLDVGALLA